MIKKIVIMLMLAMGTVCSAQELEDVKCIVMGTKDANSKFSAKYLEGEVYFCCARCKAAFEKDADKFASKANYQLVATGQYVQSGCPCTGAKTDDKFQVDVGEVEVDFCGGDCMNRVKDADDFDAMVEWVFAEKKFKQSFKPAEKKVDVSKAKCLMMPEHGVDADQWVDYLEGRVYFCCEDCKTDFEKKKQDKEIIQKANEQLFATGQYRQRLCPFTMRPLNDKNMVEIDGNEVRLCCKKCREHLGSQESDDDRAKLIYNEETFKKSFEKNKD